MVGETILHYKIEELLGRGAMGSVYRALDTRLDIHRTLKFLHLGLPNLEMARAHLVREARTQAKLIHPNISSLLALEIDRDNTFLVLEYVEGSSLDVYLKERNPSIEERIGLIIQVASALRVAHSRGIIHRDIKPANVIITEEGTAKVTDFGLAKAVGHTELSRTGETKGSVLFMPPESFRGEQVGEPADIWALGVLAYQMLEDELPFTGETYEAIAFKIIQENPRPISHRTVEKVPGIEAFIDLCLEKDQEKRIQNGEEAFSHLVEIAQTMGVSHEAWIPARVRRRTGLLPGLLPRISLAAAALLLITGAFLLFPAGRHSELETVVEFSALADEKSLTWNSDGTKIAFFSDIGSLVLTVRDAVPDAPLTHFPIQTDMRISMVTWSPHDSLLALAGLDGVFLLHLGDSELVQLCDYLPGNISWSSNGRWMVWSEAGKDDEGLMRAGPFGPLGIEDINTFDIVNIPVSGLRDRYEQIQYYDPVIILEDTRIAFALFSLAECLGMWSVPFEGGEAVQLLPAEQYPISDLVWDDRNDRILFTEFWQPNLLQLHIKKNGLPRGKVRPVRLELDPLTNISEYAYHPATGQFALLTSKDSHYIWRASLSEPDQVFEPLITKYRQTMHPAISPERKTLIFTGVNPREGLILSEYDLSTNELGDLHEFSEQHRHGSYPAVDPLEERYVLFIGYLGEDSGVLCYFDRHLNRLKVLYNPQGNAQILQPAWNAEGNAIYFYLYPGETDEVQGLYRLEVERTGPALDVGERELVIAGTGLGFPISDVSNRYLLYQELKDDIYKLRILDRVTGENGVITEGKYPALGPDPNDVYFQQGTAICRVENWVEALLHPVSAESIIKFPAGVVSLELNSPPVVTETDIYAALNMQVTGKLMILKMPD